MHLLATKEHHVHVNNTQATRSYILDFKGSHTVYVRYVDKEDTVYRVSNEFTIDNETGILLLSIV